MTHIFSTGQQEFFLCVLFDKRNEFGRIFIAVKNLALAELNIFLQVIRRAFTNTEILGGVGHFDTHFAAQTEEIIYRCLACKDNCSVIRNIHPLPSEFRSRKALDPEKLAERDVQAVLFGQVIIR